MEKIDKKIQSIKKTDRLCMDTKITPSDFIYYSNYCIRHSIPADLLSARVMLSEFGQATK